MSHGDLVRLRGHDEMDFAPLDARKLALAILDRIGDDDLAKQHSPTPSMQRVRKIGGSFQYTGTIVSEFTTMSGEKRVVIEFDPPVQGMLHIYRADQVVVLHEPPLPLSSGDEIVDAVRHKLLKRSLVGQQKYGHKMTRDDFSLLDWVKHHQEELLDAMVYTEAVLRKVELLEDDGK